MKNKWKKVTLLVMVMLMCMTQITFASSGTTTVTGDENSSKSTYQNNSRGEFLAEGSVEIVNNEDGTIGVSVTTLAYRNVDRIFHTVFLDQWDADEESWVQEDTWSFEKTSEESENGLSMLITRFTLTGYETKKYYRLRGLHGVEYMDEIEGCATETNGILITDGPT